MLNTADLKAVKPSPAVVSSILDLIGIGNTPVLRLDLLCGHLGLHGTLLVVEEPN